MDDTVLLNVAVCTKQMMRYYKESQWMSLLRICAQGMAWCCSACDFVYSLGFPVQTSAGSWAACCNLVVSSCRQTKNMVSVFNIHFQNLWGCCFKDYLQIILTHSHDRRTSLKSQFPTERGKQEKILPSKSRLQTSGEKKWHKCNKKASKWHVTQYTTGSALRHFD